MNAAVSGSAASIDAARDAFAGGNLEVAEQICAGILGQDPSEWRAWALLTETALLRGRQDAAVVSADRAVCTRADEPDCAGVAGQMPVHER